MNKKTHIRIAIILQSVLGLLLTAIISAVTRFIFIDNMFEQEYFSEQILNVWHMVFFLLIFNSLITAINQHDKYSRERFLGIAKNNKLVSHVKIIVSSIDFYLEIGCITALSLFFPVKFLYNFISPVFFYGMEITAFNNKLYTLLIMIPIMSVILFLTHIGIQKNWYLNVQKEKSNSTKEKKAKIPPVVKSVVTVAIIYCVASIIIPWLLPMFVTLWNLGGIMLFVRILIAVLVFILATVTVYYIRAILKRKSFVKKLKKYCTANSVYISNIKRPYLSLFVSQDGFDFTIEKNGTRYDCKFIAGIFPDSPIVLSDKGNGLKQDTIRIFKVELFHFMTMFDFGYESENKKILVLLPTPKTFFVSTNELPPCLADVGEKAGKYTIYNATGFLGALDRNCL